MPRMGVNINEARRNHQADDVDDPGGRLGNGGRDAHDPIAADSEIGPVSGVAAAVDDAAVAEQQVIGRALSGRELSEC
jgi:hypothetical protein